jgi:hypothetical protein
MKTLIKLTVDTMIKSILLLSLAVIPWAYASADDFTRTYNEKYAVEKGASLVIQNKFGDIQCLLWDENSVSILVTVKVEASSQEKADKTFGKIDVALTGTPSKVQGVTTVGSISNVDFSIDYEIRIPRWINIDFDNRFGDIYLSEIDGKAKINLEYGAMEAGSLNGTNTELTVKFSDAEVTYMKDASLRIEYSEWESDQLDNISLYSRFSEISIKNVSRLNLDSQYDEVNVVNAGSVITVGRFSELDFDKITADFDFDIQYGELDVNYIASTFKVGKIRNTFADANLTFDSRAGINVDAETKFGEISFPGSKSSVSEEIIGYTTHIYKGRIGSSSGTSSELSIISKNADVEIRFAE